ncbi:DNA modification protein Mom [Vibrio phage 1.187.O._10N.286.49.F1]|nr:DNA modification protein Mom [Vibrio phage 1.187.O._10N.286.49.F1]
MALQGYYVHRVERKDVRDFIETYHYSGNINGCIADYCFALYNPDGEMVGAMFYGRMAMANQWKRFSDKPDDVIELRRLCCIDDTPKNTESFFIGKSLKMLRKLWGKGVVVSYADKEYGHQGTIYKASNFKAVGEIKGAKVIMYNGRRYHDKTIRTKYKGELKPFAKRIKEALEKGEAYYKKTAGKVTYVYQL